MMGAVVVHARRREHTGLPFVLLPIAAPLFVAIVRTVTL